PASSPVAGAGLHCGGDAAAPGHLLLQMGKSQLLHLPDGVVNRSVGNPDIVQSMLIAPDTLYLLGSDVGTTNMIIEGRSGRCSVLDVEVGVDAAGLQATLAALMPDEKDIRVSAAADSLVLSGTVEDASTVLRAVELAGAYVRRQVRALTADSAAKEKAAPATPSPIASASTAQGANVNIKSGTNAANEAAAHSSRLINLLAVRAPQQVMLEVKIAEVSKSLLDKLEAGTALRVAGGGWAATLVSNFLTRTLGGSLGATKGNNAVTLEAQRQEGLIRILAEPTVMAISGQEGSFLAGGKIFIPVAQDNNKVTLEEKEFGVGLRFTPTVLAGGRINLRVAPEVSELSREGIGISAAGFSGVAVLPLITTRRAATTVQLFDGQSFAIGGLIKNNQSNNLKGLPVLGEVPVLGALFRSTDFQQDRTELLFVVTAHLVKPLPANYALPTDRVSPPSRAGFFLGGRMEGAAPQPAAAPRPEGSTGFELK
ncbi:MAG: type II and III secretion system protein family protein, partial [Burkholderiaceae bacterium]|nr:type II and III secretion system protein family protein [Burkholderiaceae bacterium]